MKQWDDKDLDRLLDRTLSEYSAEPRVGLEQRVLANLASTQAQRRRRWLWAAVPACAAVLIAVLVWTTQKSIAPPELAKAPDAPAVTKAPHTQAVQAAKVHKPTRKRSVEPQTVAAAPKLPTFPSHTDETQVQLALRFVQNNPALAQLVVKEDQEFQEATARRFELEDRDNGSETQ